METPICLSRIKKEQNEDERYDETYAEETRRVIKIEYCPEAHQEEGISNDSQLIGHSNVKQETEVQVEDHSVKCEPTDQNITHSTALDDKSEIPCNIYISDVKLKPLKQLDEIPPEILIGGPDRRKTVQPIVDDKEIIKAKSKQTHKRVGNCKKDELLGNPDENSNNNVEVKKGKKYSCKDCGEQFAQYSEFKVHKIVHQVETRHKCDKCQKCFTRAHDLVLHARVHNGEKPYSCTFCGKQFSQKINKIRHERIHTNERPFSCPVCNIAFIDQGEVAKHLRQHSGDRLYFCLLCKERFTSQDDLQQHTSNIHASTDGPYVCTICGVSLKNKTLKRNHVRDKHADLQPFSCDHCGKSFRTKLQIIKHMPVHAKRELKCTYCDKAFSSGGGRRAHEMRHGNIKPYACPCCPNSFLSSGLLSRHLRTHSDIRPYPCDRCSMTFKTKDARGRHIKMVHERSLKEYKCEFEGCEAKFYVKCNMYRHMRSSHYQLKPFCCSMCDTSYTSKGSLIYHEKTKHAKVIEKSCVTCGKNFANTKTLRRHIAKKHANAMLLKLSQDNPICKNKIS